MDLWLNLGEHDVKTWTLLLSTATIWGTLLDLFCIKTSLESTLFDV